MANKHEPLLRTQVEIAAACGVAQRKIAETLGVSRSSVQCWTGSQSKQLAYKRMWRASNKKRNKEIDQRADSKRDNAARYRRWRRLNPTKELSKSANRRAKKRGATAPLSSIESLMIKYRYEDARRLSKETGVKHHVDHVIPLAKGGPHLPWNLRVITEAENLSKGAKI